MVPARLNVHVTGHARVRLGERVPLFWGTPRTLRAQAISVACYLSPIVFETAHGIYLKVNDLFGEGMEWFPVVQHTEQHLIDLDGNPTSSLVATIYSAEYFYKTRRKIRRWRKKRGLR